MGYSTGGSVGAGCIDWAEATRSKENHGSQTEGGDSKLAIDRDRAAQNHANVPLPGKGSTWRPPSNIHGLPELQG